MVCLLASMVHRFSLKCHPLLTPVVNVKARAVPVAALVAWNDEAEGLLGADIRMGHPQGRDCHVVHPVALREAVVLRLCTYRKVRVETVVPGRDHTFRSPEDAVGEGLRRTVHVPEEGDCNMDREAAEVDREPS